MFSPPPKVTGYPCHHEDLLNEIWIQRHFLASSVLIYSLRMTTRLSCLNREALRARLDVSRQRLIKLIDLLPSPATDLSRGELPPATRLDSGSHNASPSPRAVAVVCNERCCSRAAGRSVWSASRRPGLGLCLIPAGSPRVSGLLLQYSIIS